MPWVRVDDHYDEHPKIAQVGPLGVALWAAALAYANRNGTGGFIPWAVARGLVQWEFLGPVEADGRQKVYRIGISSGMLGEDVSAAFVIDLLLDAGLWEEAEGGYQIHDYGDYQPTTETVDARREVRAAAGRLGGLAKHANRMALVNGTPSKPLANGLAPASEMASKPLANAKQKSAPVPVPVPVPEDVTPEEIKPKDLGGGTTAKTRTAAAAAPPKPQVPKSNGPPLDPLVDAFQAVGLPEPKFLGGEGKLAQGLLHHYPPETLAACWQDIASGEYGDDYMRRKLSFGLLSRDNCVGNWQRWKGQGDGPSRHGPRSRSAARAAERNGHVSALTKYDD
jgi:hypothetical protein